MWEDTRYCWVVVCKNKWFHMRQNMFFGHKIPLSETDAFMPCPALEGRFMVSAMNAARSISTNPQTCEETNNIFLSLSLPIRYFVTEGTVLMEAVIG